MSLHTPKQQPFQAEFSAAHRCAISDANHANQARVPRSPAVPIRILAILKDVTSHSRQRMPQAARLNPTLGLIFGQLWSRHRHLMDQLLPRWEPQQGKVTEAKISATGVRAPPFRRLAKIPVRNLSLVDTDLTDYQGWTRWSSGTTNNIHCCSLPKLSLVSSPLRRELLRRLLPLQTPRRSFADLPTSTRFGIASGVTAKEKAKLSGLDPNSLRKFPS